MTSLSLLCQISRMRIDVLGLQAFVSIAERGSFHGAATHLSLSQTALSHRIRKLEESLATQLFVRTTRQVTLTPAGAALLPRARTIFEDLGKAIGEVRSTSGPSGSGGAGLPSDHCHGGAAAGRPRVLRRPP
ncbi:MAG: LysR family transcriptional regulator [Aquincola sp.]|nr:LysR family transcriptional regulator [Aquincola sp.]